MKTKIAILLILCFVGLTIAHFSSLTYWSGGRDIILILDTSVPVKSVLYKSDTYKNLLEINELGADWSKFFLSASLNEARLRTEREYTLVARGSGKKSPLKTYCEIWSDGFFIRVELSDGSIKDYIQKIDPSPNVIFRIQIL